MALKRDPLLRLIEKVDVSPEGCWIWQAAKSRDGYGKFALNRVNSNAHRVAFLLLRGDIPEGYDLHHVCENTLCVNPEHLQPVTKRQHIALTPNANAYHRLAFGHCKNGHNPDVTGWSGNRIHGHCLLCVRERNRRRAKRIGMKHSKYRGVGWAPLSQKWEARIKLQGTLIHLGTYRDEEEAAYIYNQAALQLRGRKAILNQL